MRANMMDRVLWICVITSIFAATVSTQAVLANAQSNFNQAFSNDDELDDFEELDAELETDFLQTDALLEARYQAIHKAIQAAYSKQTRKIEVVWPDAVVVPEGAVWVAYNADYQERLVYDFEQGYYDVEVPLSGDTLKDLQKLQALIAKVQRNKTTSLQNMDVFTEAFLDELPKPNEDAASSLVEATATLNQKAVDGQSKIQNPDLLANYELMSSVSAVPPTIDIQTLAPILNVPLLEVNIPDIKIREEASAQLSQTLPKPSNTDAISQQIESLKLTKSSDENQASVTELLQYPVQNTDTKAVLEVSENGWRLRVPFVNNYQQSLIQQRLETILDMSKRFSVDVSLILAIIEAESSFNPMATSNIPAFGLMQLVPKTAGVDAYRHVYGEHKILSPEYLYDVDNNLELGTAYLDLLQTRYLRGIDNNQNKLYSIVASYNTGVGNLAKTVVGNKRIRMAVPSINQMQPQQYYDYLQANLPATETKRYLDKVVTKMKKYEYLDNK